jgi:DNA helicase-2/ATP-dependent DNA helicase PcrA
LIDGGTPPGEIAVLYRANFQSRAIEDAFLSRSLPYQLLGTRFFERKEVKDILAFLRLALNPDSTGDLSRIINVPPRGIGKITLLKILENKKETLSGATAEKVQVFDELMASIRESARAKRLSETIKHVIKGSGLEDMLKKGGEEELERLENLRELVSLATRYDEYDPAVGAEHLLEDAALQSDQDELKDGDSAVRLMTVHAAKGLEFDCVCISGLEEGLFPHERLSDERTDEEEERRLFYVALTRARRKVFLSFTHIRTVYGSQRMNVPSSFLADIPDEHLAEANPAESGHERIIEID